jgi:hypothetical protein
MDRNGLNPVANPELHTCQQVAVKRVDPTWPQQADEMKGTAGLPQPGAELHQRLDVVEVAALNALRNTDQILRDYPSGT